MFNIKNLLKKSNKIVINENLCYWKIKTKFTDYPYEYSLFLMDYVAHDTLEEGIAYYEKLLQEFEAYYDSLNIVENDNESLYCDDRFTHKRTYAVNIKHYYKTWIIYVDTPTFYSLNDIRLWLRGLVKQLNEMM